MAHSNTSKSEPSRFRQRLNHFFRERELILRSEGKVRYLRLSSGHQKLAASAACALGLWLGVANGWAVFQEHRLEAKQAQINEAGVAYERLRSELSLYQERLAGLADGISQQQNAGTTDSIDLKELATVTAGIESAFDRISRDLDLTAADRLRIIQSRDALHQTISALETDLQSAHNQIAALNETISRNETTLEEKGSIVVDLTEKRDAWQGQAETLEQELASARSNIVDLEDGLALRDKALRNDRETIDHLTQTNETLEGERERLTQSLETAQAEIVSLDARLTETSGSLQSERATVRDLTQIRQRLDAQVAILTDGLASAEARSNDLVENVENLTQALRSADVARIELDSQRTELANDLSVLEAELNLHMAATEKTRERLETVVTSLAEQLNETDLGEGNRRDALLSLEGKIGDIVAELTNARGNVSDMELAIGDVVVGLARVAGESSDDVLDSAIGPLEKVALTRNLLREVEAVQDDQEILIARLSDETRNKIRRNELLIRIAGLDVQQLLGLSGFAVGMGGPLSALEDDNDVDMTSSYATRTNVAAELLQVKTVQSEFDMFAPSRDGLSVPVSGALSDEVEMLETRLTRLSALNLVMRCLPLISPVDNFQMTSPFGPRRDPITGQQAQHDGIDIGGWSGIPVHVTAPGTVVYVGRNGGYGKMVEVDHGCGITTVYAHLKRTKVSVGDVLGHREVVGTLGSTGRSTGPHVHYEVQVDGTPVDPERLIEAGRHVHKT